MFHSGLVLWLALFVLAPSLVWGTGPVVITSGSMAPLIRTGDVVLLRTPDDPAALAPGAVVTFRDDGSAGALTTHRIVSVTGDGAYRTRGDANAVDDPASLAPAAVEGVATLLIPLAGLPVIWWRTAPWRLAIWSGIALAAAWVALRPPPVAGPRPDLDAPRAGGVALATEPGRPGVLRVRRG